MEYLYSGQLLTVSDETLPSWTFTIHPSPCQCQEPDEATSGQSLVELLQSFAVELGNAAQKFVCSEIQGQIESMTASPVHDAMLIATSRNQLWLLEFLSNGTRASPSEDPCAKLEATIAIEPRLLDSSSWEEGIADPSWSSDGIWIAYCRRDSMHGASVLLMNLETSSKTVVSDATFLNYCPRFHPEGLYLAFLSTRYFAPLEDDVTTDLTFASGADVPLLVLLSSEAQNPFLRKPISPAKAGDEADEGSETDADSNDSNAENINKPSQIRVDVENLDQRLLQFPVKPGHYSACAWTADGHLLYLRDKPAVVSPYIVDDEDEPETKSTMLSFDFVKLKEEQLWDDVLDFSLSLDAQNMLLRMGDEDDEDGKYFALKAGAGEPEDEEVDMSTPGPDSGMLDMDRLSIQVVDAEERLSIFCAIRAFVFEHLFDKDCGGVDWADTCKRYQAILPRVRSNAEFEDLCCEMLAELGLSHVSYRVDADQEEPKCKHLGVATSWVDFEGGGAYRVDEVLQGDVWDTQCSGPLARPGVGIHKGALILALNRVRVSQDVSIDQMLAGAASSEVFVTYVPKNAVKSFAKLQQVWVQHGGIDGLRQLRRQSTKAPKTKGSKSSEKGRQKPGKAEKAEKQLEALFRQLDISDEQQVCLTARVCAAGEDVILSASMRDLIECRRRKVHEATSGRVGYMYVPDTTRLGFAEFYRASDARRLSANWAWVSAIAAHRLLRPRELPRSFDT